MATLLVSPKFQAFDANGDPLNGGFLYSYVAGTDTPKDTYTDGDAGTANTNPVELDTRGEADVWLDNSALYKLVLKDSAGATIWTVDNVGQDTDQRSTFKGPTAPTNPVAGQLWIDDNTPSSSVWTWSVYDGTSWISLGTINASNNTFRVTTDRDDPAYYGAAGDGTTDDAGALQAAIDDGVTCIDGRGRTYRVDSTLTLRSNLEIRNAVIDFSNAVSGDVLFYASGTTGSSNLLTGNRSRFSVSLPVTSAGTIAAGSYLLVGSTANYESNTSTKVGEIARVRSYSALTALLRDATYSTYNTADAAYVKELTFVENVTLRNIKARGAGDGTAVGGQDQYGARFVVCRNVKMIDCDFENFDYAGVEFATCLDVSVRGGNYSRAYDAGDGASYGIMLTQGTHHARIEGITSFDTRHGVTTGGTTAVNRHITVTGSTFSGCRASAIDNHAGTELFTWDGNTISAEVGDLSSGTQAALQSLGGSGVISNNVIRGAFEHGILVQVFPLGIQCPVVVSGNVLVHGASTDADHIGIFVEQRNDTTNSGITITDNVLNDGWQTGIMLEADAADIKYFTITDNNLGLVATRGIYLNAPTGRLIEHGTICNNSMRVDTGGSENIFLTSVDAAGIEFVTIAGNTCFDGTYGVRGVNTDRIATVGNVAVSASTTAVDVAGGNSTSANNVTT